MDASKLRFRRKASRPIVNSKTPAVARERAAEARGKIEAGLAALRGVRSADGIKALQEMKSISVEGFLNWKELGNDTLYKTHRDLLPALKTELIRVQALSRSRSRPKNAGNKRWSETASLRARVLELEGLLAARNKDCAELIMALESARKEVRSMQTGAPQ